MDKNKHVEMHDNLELYEIITLLEIGIDSNMRHIDIANILATHNNSRISKLGKELIHSMENGLTLYEALYSTPNFPKPYANIALKSVNCINPFTQMRKHIDTVLNYRTNVLNSAFTLQKLEDLIDIKYESLLRKLEMAQAEQAKKETAASSKAKEPVVYEDIFPSSEEDEETTWGDGASYEPLQEYCVHCQNEVPHNHT